MESVLGNDEEGGNLLSIALDDDFMMGLESMAEFSTGCPKKMWISNSGLFEGFRSLRSKKFRSLTPNQIKFYLLGRTIRMI